MSIYTYIEILYKILLKIRIICLELCTKDSTLCQNNGQCVDDSTNKKGFYCICSTEYQGETCEKRTYKI